jgi:predicted transposase YbfD/YdcC
VIASSRSTPCTAKKTFEIARETGNELIVQVKGNQPGLLQHCEDAAATSAPIATAASRDLARNRQEDRRVEVYVPGAALNESEWRTFIAAIVRVTRSTLIRSAATGMWKRREETAFYASSVMLPAETFASAIRGHWAVENVNHWVRDVTLAEDASRIRVNPGVMARLRSQALNIARANGVENIAQALWSGAIDPAVTLSYRGL